MAGRFALIIAVDTYEHSSLDRLRAPAHDAEALTRVLADPGIGCFQVTVVQNQPAHVIRREVANFLSDRQPDDCLLVHFSGHGLKSAAGELYLAGNDTVPNRLSATAVPAQFVNAEIAECRARQVVLLLDCCYGAAFSHGLRARGDDTMDVKRAFPLPAAGKGRVVITASSAIEYAFEDDRVAEVGARSPSVFTGALVHGLKTGEADTGRDGLIDVDELYDYVHARVRSITSQQTPHKWADVQGTIVIGIAPAASRLRPAVLPAELVAQARDTLPRTRLAAVTGLRRILLDHDLERAVGALDLLRQLAADDSREVSAAAAATLDEAQLKALPERVHFPAGPPGQPQPSPGSQLVRLAGPPLARVFHATSSARWLRLEHSRPPADHDAWVNVTLDRAGLAADRGELHGTVTVTNRLGLLEIPVTAAATGRRWPLPSSAGPAAVPAVPAWARGSKALYIAAAAVVAACLLVVNAPSPSATTDSQVVSFIIYLVRGALLIGGITLLTRSGQRRVAGLGITAAYVSFFLADAVIGLYQDASPFAWLEFFAVLALIALLAIRLWPLPGLPRRVALTAPGNSPLPWTVLAAAAAQVFLLFVSVQDGQTIEGFTGFVGGLLVVLPIAGLCVAVTLTGPDRAQQEFATAAILAYLVPEVTFMLGSLLFGSQFTYFGDDIGGPTWTADWFVIVQAAAACTLGASTLLLLKEAQRTRVVAWETRGRAKS